MVPSLQLRSTSSRLPLSAQKATYKTANTRVHVIEGQKTRNKTTKPPPVRAIEAFFFVLVATFVGYSYFEVN